MWDDVGCYMMLLLSVFFWWQGRSNLLKYAVLEHFESF